MNPFEEDEDDPWPDEPDEFDPDSLGPGAPEPPSVGTGEGDVDRETFRAFWGAVIMANVGLLLPSLGLMLWYFEGMRTVGVVLILLGSVSLLRTYRTYRNYVDRDDGEGAEADSDAADSDAADADSDGIDADANGDEP